MVMAEVAKKVKRAAENFGVVHRDMMKAEMKQPRQRGR